MAARPMRCQGKGCRNHIVPPSFFAMAKGDEERAKRLAEALRQNLRRRKAQARGENDPSFRRKPESVNAEPENKD